LWRAVLTDYQLEEHELVLLRQAVRVADACDALQAIVDRDGLMVGGRPHRGLVELRAQQITLARLVVALRVPMGDQGQRSQYRGARGVYAIGGGVS
jgi:hypothetical protein